MPVLLLRSLAFQLWARDLELIRQLAATCTVSELKADMRHHFDQLGPDRGWWRGVCRLRVSRRRLRRLAAEVLP